MFRHQNTLLFWVNSEEYFAAIGCPFSSFSFFFFAGHKVEGLIYMAMVFCFFFELESIPVKINSEFQMSWTRLYEKIRI